MPDITGNVPEHVFRTIAVAADIDPQDTIDNPQFRMVVEAAYIHGRASAQADRDRFKAELVAVRDAAYREYQRLDADLREAYTILATINTLHQPHTNSDGGDLCKACNTLWPCRTSKTIEGPAPVPGSSQRAQEPADDRVLAGLAEALRQREQLVTTLAEVLRYFHEKGHPGEPCLRTGWIRESTVQQWQQVLYGLKAIDGAAWLAAGEPQASEPAPPDRRYVVEMAIRDRLFDAWPALGGEDPAFLEQVAAEAARSAMDAFAGEAHCG